MHICIQCHQPITNGSLFDTSRFGMGKYHLKTEVSGVGVGCPLDSEISANLEMAMSQGFKPEFRQFCPTHYKLNESGLHCCTKELKEIPEP